MSSAELMRLLDELRSDLADVLVAAGMDRPAAKAFAATTHHGSIGSISTAELLVELGARLRHVHASAPGTVEDLTNLLLAELTPAELTYRTVDP